MKKTENRIELKGMVTNFKLNETKSKKQLGKLTVCVDENGKKSFHNITMFDRKQWKINKVETTLGALKSIFLNEAGKPNDVYVHLVGSSNETVNDQGKLFNNESVNLFLDCDSEDNQKAVFLFKGFVSKVAEFENELDEEYKKITIDTYNYWGKDEIAGLMKKTVVVRDSDLLEELEDLEVGDFVTMKGDIINEYAARDKYGDTTTDKGIQEYRVVGGRIEISADEMEDDDAALYKAARKMKQGERLNIDEFIEKMNAEGEEE